MMKKTYLAGVLSMATLVSCTASEEHDTAAPSARLAALGVVSLDVVETDARLVVTGRNALGQPIANLELTTGAFEMQEDDRGVVSGRQLAVHVYGRELRHESEGYAHLQLPTPPQADVATFLADPAVAAQLGRWGISLDAAGAQTSLEALFASQTDERAYTDPCAPYGVTNGRFELDSTTCVNTTYAGCSTLLNKPGKKWPKSGGSEYGEYRCCFNGSVINAVERACTTPNGTSTCGATGTNGCAVCWITPNAWDCLASKRTEAPYAGYCQIGWCVF